MTDFGIAIAHSDHIVQTAPGEAGEFAGSLDYMAPERIMGARGRRAGGHLRARLPALRDPHRAGAVPA